NSSIERRAAKSCARSFDLIRSPISRNTVSPAAVSSLISLNLPMSMRNTAMRALAMHVGERSVEQPVERIAIREAGERVVILKIAQALLRTPLFAASRPGKRDRRRYAGAEQEYGDGGDQAEIAGQHFGLLTLIEIDEQ